MHSSKSVAVAMQSENNKHTKAIIYGAGESAVHAFQLHDGKLTELNQQSTSGKRGSYVSMHPSGQYLATNNFASGEVMVFDLNNNGSISSKRQLFKHGKKSQPHWVKWDAQGKHLYSVFRGDDVIRRYAFDQKGQLSAGEIAWQGLDTDGPRHLIFHPNKPLAYLLTETSSQVVVLQHNPDGSFTTLQRISCLPENYAGNSKASHLAISQNGDFLYTSNRGDFSSVSVFAISDDGNLSLAEREQEKMEQPRSFALVEKNAKQEKLMVVGNRFANALAAYQVAENGSLNFITASAPTLKNVKYVIKVTAPKNPLSN